MASAPFSSKLVAEFVGTFLLVFTIGCNVLGKTPVWAPVSIACVLMVCIYGLGGISGGHFNPAVTLSLALTKLMNGPGIDLATMTMYWVAQVLGGFVGAMCYVILFSDAFNLGPAKAFGVVSAGVCETLYTFMLCFVVLNVAAAKKYSEGQMNEYYGLAIGFVIIAGAYGCAGISGGCFNPAVAFGIDASSAGMGFGWCFPYAAFEFFGAALAAVAFRLVRPADFDAEHGPWGKMQPKLISEFLGTYMLVLTVGLNVLGNSAAGAFSIAASLMCMIYALGDVSGAHFNPAVTFAILITQRTTLCLHEAVQYMLVQTLAGVLAAVTYSAIYKGYSFDLGPLPGYGWKQVAAGEMLFTFVLCYTVLCVAGVMTEKTKSSAMFGLAIGSCVTVGGFAIGSISGGSMNPAVSMGVSSVQFMNGGFFYKALLYAGFEFAGAAAAAGVASLTHPDKPLLLDTFC